MLTTPQAISNFEILLNRNYSENNGRLVINGPTHEQMFREAHGYPAHNFTPKNTKSKRTFRDVVCRDRRGNITSITELKCQGAKPDRIAPGRHFQIVLTRRSAGLTQETPPEIAMQKIMDDLFHELDEVMEECGGEFGISTMIYSNEKVAVWNESGEHLLKHLRRPMKAEWVTKDIGDRTTNNLWISDAETDEKIISYTSHSKTELICRIPEDHMVFHLRSAGKVGFISDEVMREMQDCLRIKNVTKSHILSVMSKVVGTFDEY
jgi:hypothetical protein